MSKGLKAVIIASALVLFVTTTAYAASSTFLPRAQQLYDQMCKRGRASGSAAMLCYLFDKTSELQTSVNNLGNKVQGVEEKTDSNSDEIDELKDLVSTQSAKIEELEEKLQELETGDSSVEIIELFSFQQLIHGQESLVIDTEGFDQLVLDANSQNGSGGIHLLYSDDQVSWVDQGGVSVASGIWNEHVQRSFPVLGRYYKASVFNNFKGWSKLTLYP